MYLGSGRTNSAHFGERDMKTPGTTLHVKTADSRFPRILMSTNIEGRHMLPPSYPWETIPEIL